MCIYLRHDVRSGDKSKANQKRGKANHKHATHILIMHICVFYCSFSVCLSPLHSHTRYFPSHGIKRFIRRMMSYMRLWHEKEQPEQK